METIKRKCKVVMLPTKNKVTKIEFNPNRWGNNKLYYSDYGAGGESQHLYIINKDEIQIHDWVYNSKGTPKIQKRNSDLRNDDLRDYGWRKIIASTDESLNIPKPSKSFIKKYCEEGGIDEVLVEFEDDVIKTNSSNEISISKIKDSYTREEVIDLLYKFGNTMECMDYSKPYYRYENWIEENL